MKKEKKNWQKRIQKTHARRIRAAWRELVRRAGLRTAHRVGIGLMRSLPHPRRCQKVMTVSVTKSRKIKYRTGNRKLAHKLQ
jgi:hypothetical protein